MTRTEERRLVAALRRAAKKLRKAAEQEEMHLARQFVHGCSWGLSWDAVAVVQRFAERGRG